MPNPPHIDQQPLLISSTPGAGLRERPLLAGLPLLLPLLPLQGQVCLAVACQESPPALPPAAAGGDCQRCGQAGLVRTSPRHWVRQRCRQLSLGQLPLVAVAVAVAGLRLLRAQAEHMAGAGRRR